MLKIFFLFFSCILVNECNVYSQNISFEELIKLQMSRKQSVSFYFKKKSWLQNQNNKNIWSFGDTNPDNTQSVFVLREENCNENVIYYIMIDTSNYKILKSKAAISAQKSFEVNYPFSKVSDYTINELNYRFYESHEPNQASLYSVWVFSQRDSWFYSEINKICFYKINTQSFDINDKAIDSNFIIMPEFPGGENGRIDYLYTNINYPMESRENGIMGTVYANFVVETDGSISDIVIVKGVADLLDKETIRLIKNMPRWRPGSYKGKPVKVQCNMQMVFSLK